MRAASKRDVEMNTRREIPYQQVPMYYFIFYINCQYYFIFYINSIIAFYCQEKSTLLTNENRRIDNSQIKIVKWGSRWKNALNHYKTKMGVMSINKILSYWLLSFWEKFACGKSSSSWCSLSVARNVIAKATEYASFGFSFCVLVFHPFYKWLKVASCKQYRFFSVLTAIILENSNKWPWIGNGEGFAIHLSTWVNGTKSKWWVSSWLALSNTCKKILFFFFTWVVMVLLKAGNPCITL